MTSRHLFSALMIAAMWCANSVWAATFTGTFQKITSVNDLTTGYYVIAASESAQANADYAMGATIKSGHLNGEAIDITEGTTITNPDNRIVYLITRVGRNTYTFQTMAVPETVLYVYRVNNTNGGGLKIDPTYASYITCEGYMESPNGFMFTFDGDGNNKKLQFNAGTLYFANYSGNYSVGMTPVRLFKLVEEPDPGSATALDNTETATPATKILRDGRLLILRGNSVFTAQGQKVE